MHALIQKTDNTILRIAPEGSQLAEEKPFYWLECPDDCKTNWTFDGNQFSQPAPPPPPTPEQIVAQYTDQIQNRLDNFAATRGYDGILSACTYATSPTPKFATEGQYCIVQRDATWAEAYTILDEVLSGIRPMPTLEELFAELPDLTWPI